MKRTVLASALMICAVAVSFAQSNTSNLCQKWKVDLEAFMADLPPEMTAMIDMLPAEQKDMAMAQMTDGLKKLYIKFNSDGSVESVDDSGPIKGSWKFIEGEKAIWTKMKEEETIMDLIELNSGKMRVKERAKKEGQPDMVLTMVPFDS